jgi:hypothetical protein
MHARVLFVPIFLSALGGAACGSGQADITNPSGACGTRSDGGRVGYHGPEARDQWVLDCQNPLLREYWRAFSQDGNTAYVVPRPDGAAELSGPCSDASHELHPVVVRYGLCSAAQSPEQVGAVNHMALSDALGVTHFLHAQLKFVATQVGVGISPYPLPSDILDACVLGNQVNSAELDSICRDVKGMVDQGIEKQLIYTGPGGAELAMRLNQLYGIW